MQQGDVKLTQTPDGGEISIKNGIMQMSGGLETAVYLSLFGGNEDDDGRDQNPHTWWGNRIETTAARKYVSETQHLLQALSATTGNLRRIEDAVKRDLAWLESENVASDVSVSVSMTGVNRINIAVSLAAYGNESQFEFAENWKEGIA